TIASPALTGATSARSARLSSSGSLNSANNRSARSLFVVSALIGVRNGGPPKRSAGTVGSKPFTEDRQDACRPTLRRFFATLPRDCFRVAIAENPRRVTRLDRDRQARAAANSPEQTRRHVHPLALTERPARVRTGERRPGLDHQSSRPRDQ